jgi:predicted esterase
MAINTNYLSVSKTARYSTLGNLSENTKYFWFALHGSKMLCEQVLYKFSEFDPDTHFVVAPEALIRYYEKGFGGEVVASWMTSRDRDQEIDDFSNYLNLLYNKYTSNIHSDCKKIIMGFSQGGTTLYRWLHNSSIEADHILAYSCWIPEDIDLNDAKSPLDKIQQIYTYGIQDQFLKEERVDPIKVIMQKNNLNIKIESYTGDHRIDKTQLKYIFDRYFK